MTLPKYLEDALVIAQQELAENVYSLVLSAKNIADSAKPGQFIDLRLLNGAFTLRRPFGIAMIDKEKGQFTIVYRVLGKGTTFLSQLTAGDMVNVLGPLGNGFDMKAKRPLIVGGGMGLSPVLFYAIAMNGKADVLMGGKNACELFWHNLYKDHVKNIFCTTDDGSLGEKGFVTTLLPKLLVQHDYDLVVTCGPEIMMRSVAKVAAEHEISCEVSLEKRMGCGLSACLSCSIDTADGKRKKVCKDGPVFKAEEVFYEK